MSETPLPVLLDAAAHERQSADHEAYLAALRAGSGGVEPEPLRDVWGCPSCDRRFPSEAATERHIEFEHAETTC